MFKLLLFLFVLLVIYVLRRGMARSETRRESGTPASSGKVETVLECAHCGLLVPQSEGTRTAGLFYCSPEHARQGPRSAP